MADIAMLQTVRSCRRNRVDGRPPQGLIFTARHLPSGLSPRRGFVRKHMGKRFQNPNVTVARAARSRDPDTLFLGRPIPADADRTSIPTSCPQSRVPLNYPRPLTKVFTKVCVVVLHFFSRALARQGNHGIAKKLIAMCRPSRYVRSGLAAGNDHEGHEDHEDRQTLTSCSSCPPCWVSPVSVVSNWRVAWLAKRLLEEPCFDAVRYSPRRWRRGPGPRRSPAGTSRLGSGSAGADGSVGAASRRGPSSAAL